jgi:hypothetical protein
MRRAKYRAKPTTVDGIRFASKKEARRFSELKLLERAGKIADLELQPRYDLHVAGKKVAAYVADFRYVEGGETIIEDVKGMKTPMYRMKKKMVMAEYGIVIRET